MKTVKETIKKTVTEDIEYEEVTYVCDAVGCAFQTKDEDESIKHAAGHAIKHTTEIDGRTFLYIETQEGMDALVASGKSCDSDDFFEGRFVGPGWYYRNRCEEPCRRGCCTNYGIRIEYYASLTDGWKHTRDRCIERLKNIQALNAIVPESIYDC